MKQYETKPTPDNQAPARPGLGFTVARDFLASIVVFLVALPLCMGIAIASGVPEGQAAAIGILAGVIGGLVVGLLSGCPLQVTGPAAGLVVIVGDLVSRHGFETLGLIVMMAGAIQFLAALLGLGRMFRAVSPAVIQGMLAGIGLLIFASQFHVMVDDRPPGSDKELVQQWGGVVKGGVINLLTIPEAVWKGFTEYEHRSAAMIGVLTILAIIAWGWLVPKRYAFLPAPLFGVVLATVAAYSLDFGLKKIEVPDNLTELAAAITLPTWDSVPFLFSWTILGAALALAFVASAESLLTAAAADVMQQHAPRTKFGRELSAQGVGNFVAGCLGLLPLTGVIVRTGANIQAGARTRLSTFLHGVWLLGFVVLLPHLLQLIPIASLAAVLVYTGWKLMNPKPVRHLLRFGKSEVGIYFATLIFVVAIDLLVGILVGLGLAVVKLLYTFSHLNVRVEEEPAPQGEVVLSGPDLSSGEAKQNGRTILRLEGAATFIRLPKLAQVLESVPPSTELHVHFEELTYIDHACLDLLMNWEKQHCATGGKLVIDWDNLTARFHRYGNGNSHRKHAARVLVGTKHAGNGSQRLEPAGHASEKV